ncbi:MAG: NADP-dependent oxidoreductase [Caulobacteraceae bacterium]|nr:NADP-dependent oxidoreductase [Caulobacteraceae bacterium]
MNRYWTLSEQPLGPLPTPDTFNIREAPIPEPAEGQALTRTIYVSLDPYQWGYRRRGVEKPGDVCHARTVGQVCASRLDGFAPGDFVFSTAGWAEFGLVGEGVARPAYMIPRKLDPTQGPISYAVGVLGMLGLTAWSGMVLLGKPQAGQTAVVSAASGGVGQIAGQLARLQGMRVVGIAGREEKCRFVVDELGFDACVSHLAPDFPDQLRAACPEGVDVYFENVGGPVFEATLPLFRPKSRMVICGLIAHYGESGDARAELMRRGAATFAERKMEVRDLFVGDFVADHQDRFLAEMTPLVARGDVKYLEDRRHGFEALPGAFIDMMSGANFGKTLVQINPDQSLGERGASKVAC